MRADEQNQLIRRHSSTLHYQTFDTPPPRSRGRPNSGQSGSSGGESHYQPHDSGHEPGSESPLPKRQMAVLAMISLCEQTAFNSISPYLPDMATSFPEVEPNMVGVYVGAIATAFAVAQLVTNYFWGWLSDRVGRKPVILLGTILTAGCFLAFGFCKTLYQAIIVQAFMGAVNGNQGLVSTCLGEITDRSNQSKAFTYLPVLYGIGGITGPLLGGLLIFERNPFDKSKPNPFPYLAPNAISAVILVVDFVLSIFFLEESHEDADTLPNFSRRVRALFSWLWEWTSAAKNASRMKPPHGAQYRHLRTQSDDSQDHDSELDSASEVSETREPHHESLTRSEIFNRDTVLLLLTYLIFALCNVSFNSLFPIFSQAPPPIGRGLGPSEIGLAQGFSGFVTIIFQICIFGKLRDKMGNRWSYRAGLFGFVIAFILMPFVGYKSKESGSALVGVELCFAMLVKTVASVGGLTSALLLITNSAPDHAVLGSLNGLAQTLSAAGRAAGPFLSGSLFSMASRLKQKGEAMPFGVFAAVSFVGFILSFGIRGRSLEAEDWESDSDDTYKSDDDEAAGP
ncbi:MFS general substrate transporter [Aspergillus heteromorphus CBS 117.55]|uniref:MFS general substrate transporter n=1 Tax=Aspergillus heteromorphus CBS 117.55 TaxID=1448321 RepID=A0A317VK75_9EURO|nr:MFS general substrate transporter [Aspergillus heteromorphus CBS 117.55]PWY72310.1 MFS general substrate transporter [Aspergillus heteromorphus CBS 117.55]